MFRFSFLEFIFVKLLWVVFSTLLVSSLQAQSINSDEASDGNKDLAYCATFLPCAMVVGLMDANSQSMAALERVRNFFSGFGKRPAKSESEFKAWLTSMSGAERQKLVKDCTNKRGEYMLDWCQENFLTDSEFSEAKKSKTPTRSDNELRGSANRALQELQRRDEQILSVLRVSCTVDNGNPSYGCTSQLDLMQSLSRDEKRFNEDYQNRLFGLSFQSKGGLFFSQFYEWKNTNRDDYQWVAKEPIVDEPWKNLPSSAGTRDSAVDKQLASAIKNASDSRSSEELFSGTSNDLSDSSIEAQRDKFNRTQESLSIFTEAALSVSQQLIAQKVQQQQLQQLQRQQAQQQAAAQQQLRQQQAKAQQQARANTSQQRIYSDDPGKEYMPPAPTDQRVYSDDPRKEYIPPTPADQRVYSDSNETTWAYLETVAECITVIRRPKKNTYETPWYDLKNKCGYEIAMHHTGLEGYGYSGITYLEAGGTGSTWTGSGKLFYDACRRYSPSGATIFLEHNPEKTMARCRYKK